jgi:O-antigen/teichoic acid export membrane protein
VLPRAAGLLSVPIYTRVLGPEDFGRYELLISLVTLLYTVCLVGMDFAISVRFFELSEPDQRVDVAAALMVAGAASLCVSGVLVVLGGVLGPLALQSSNGSLPFLIAIASAPANVLAGVLAMYLRLRFKASAFFLAAVGGAIVGTVVGVVLVLAFGLGLVGAVLGLAVANALTLLLVLVGCRGLVTPARHPDKDRVAALVRTGAPLVPAYASSWVFAVADRFFVSAFLGFAQLGLYAAAARLGTILILLQYGFHAAWGPSALRWGTAPDRERRYEASLRLVAVAGGATATIVSWLAAPLLWILAGPSYVGAAKVVWLLAGSVVFSAMFFIVQIGSNLAKRGDKVAIATIVAAVVNTVANLALIPPLGYVGAGWATLFAYAAAYVIMYVMSQTVTHMRIGFRNATAWATAWTVAAAGSTVAPESLRPILTLGVVLLAMTAVFWAVASAAPILARPSPAAAPAAVSHAVPLPDIEVL